MNDDILKYSNIMPTYFEKEYNSAIEILTSHMKNKHYYLHDRQIAYNNVTISEDYSTKNLNNATFINCKFLDCNLSSVSMINSKFFNCKFSMCDLTSTNFRNSVINKCIFEESNKIINSKFGNCKISNCDFIDCTIDSCVLDEAFFSKCTFKNNLWIAVSTYLCLFEDVSFTSVKFRNMNFEYSIFSNIHMNDMKLPFPTIPYIFGGLNYLLTTDDNICITSQHNLKNGITKKEYLTQLKNLEIFYSYTCNYFPLANIYLTEKKNDYAKSAIMYGIIKAIEQSDFKMLTHYARLISMNPVFTPTEKHALYNNVIAKVAKSLIDNHNEINKYILDFRTFLFNDESCSSFHLSIKTNIESEAKLAILIEEIEDIIHSNNVAYDYSIELRHNSPFELFLKLFANYDEVCLVLGMLILALKGIDIVIKKVFEYKKLIQDDEKNYLEKKINKQQIILNDLEIAAKREELQNKFAKSMAEPSNSPILENDIQSITYVIITNNTTNIIPPSDYYE